MKNLSRHIIGFVLSSVAVTLLLLPSAHGVTVTFTIDSAQTTLTGSGTMGGSTINQQGPGSLTARFSGTITANMDSATSPTTIQIIGAVFNVLTNGSWSPLPGGSAGTAAANYGAQVSGTLFAGTAAIRSFVINGQMPASVAVTSGQFPSASLQFTVNSASLDYNGTVYGIPQSGTTSLQNYQTNNLAGNGSVSVASGTATMQIPINFQVLKSVGGVIPLVLNCNGNLVATAPVSGSSPTITTTSPLPSGTVGTYYSTTLAATGGSTPYTWSITSGSLPAGLNLSSGGVISGTPTTPTTASFTVQVSGGGTATKAFTLTINSAGVTPTDGNWAAQHVELTNTTEAAFMARMGDIDNLNFGWPAGFNPFSGNSTPVHSFPWTVDPTDALGTDRIMVLTSYGTKAVPCGRDGYTGTTTRPGNNVQTLTLTYSLPAITVSNAVLQLFVDDFQAPVWCANYQVTINGRRASFLEAVINSLIQTGPIGKLITVQVPTSFLNEVTSGSLAIKIDDTTTGAGDGYAIDFVKLLVNVNTTGMQNGTISGHVRRAGTSTAIVGAQVTCVGVTATTDSAGAYTLANVPAGLAFVQASATGFNTTNQFATVIAGQITANVDFTMTTNTTAGSGAVRPDVGFTTGGQLAANDDSYTSSAMPIGFSINYYGTNFSSVFVNNNGNVTFDHGYSTYTPYGISNVVAYIMAPFFADVDTRATNSQVVTWGNSTVNGHNAFGVNWVNVGYYSSHGDKLNKFQLVLIDRSDTGAGNFDMEFNYDYVLWETGDASGGSSGFGGKSAAVGFSNGSLLPGTYYQMPGSLVPGSFLDTNAVTGLVHGQQNSGVLGRYVWSVRSGYAMLTIQAQSLPTGSVGTVYAPQTMHASGGSGTYTSWTIAAGSLPPGLNLNNSGIISGTPTTSGTFTFTVQVTDSLSATAQQSFTIAVTGAGTSGAVRPDAGFITGGSLPANDDDYTAAAIPLGFTINFYGTSFSELYVNNNGNATLDQGYPDYTPFGIAGVSNVYIMAPFFADVDTTANSSIVTWGTSTVNGHAAFGVNWVNVNHYDSTANTGAALNSFQLVLIDRSDTGAGNFDMEFNYDRILWETGDADGGTNGLGGISATIGFSNGSGTPGTYYQMPGSMVPGSFLDGNPTTGLVHGQQNSGGVLGRYVWRVRNGNALTIQTTTLPAGTVGASYGSQTLQATGGTTPYIWTVAAGSLPPGLNLSSGGVLSGTPTGAGGSYTFTVQVADNAGGTAQQSYTVTINACNYTIATSASPAGGGTARGGIVNCGSPITVTATANPCYSFVKWTENGAQVSTSANYTFTPAANRTLIAVFAQTTYTIATSVNPSGAGTVGGSGSQPCGNTVTLTATPAAGGYYFVNWTENGAIVSTAASYSFTASGNRTLVANFGGGIMIVTPSLLPTGMVGAAYSKTLQATNGTTPYKWTVVTGSRLPTGMKLNATTGALTGKPTAPGAYTFRIRVTGANGQYAERDFTLVVITPPMAPLAGTYNGLILHATTPLFGNGGALKIVLSRTGSFAANISLGGVATAYSGQFDPTGNYQTNNLVRRGRSALQIILHLDLTGATKQITGTINDGTFTSQVLADLQYYSASNPCPWAGKYNCLLEPTVVSTTVPQGVGYGTFTVTASGSAALAGTLADGTAVSCTMPVSKWGTWPLYKLLYTNKGAAIGWLAFTSGTTLAGSVDWIKPAATSGRYLAGFNTLVNLTGVKLTPPDGPGVWHITLAGGDIGGSVLRNVTVSATGAGNVTPVDAYKLSLKVTVATGKFTGSFVHPSTGRPVSFSGLFLQAPENNAGGFFLGPNTSGAVTLEP